MLITYLKTLNPTMTVEDIVRILDDDTLEIIIEQYSNEIDYLNNQRNNQYRYRYVDDTMTIDELYNQIVTLSSRNLASYNRINNVYRDRKSSRTKECHQVQTTIVEDKPADTKRYVLKHISLLIYFILIMVTLDAFLRLFGYHLGVSELLVSLVGSIKELLLLVIDVINGAGDDIPY